MSTIYTSILAGSPKKFFFKNVWLPLICPLLGTWPSAQAYALTGNRTSDPLRSQADAQPTEPHQPGQVMTFNNLLINVYLFTWVLQIPFFSKVSAFLS